MSSKRKRRHLKKKRYIAPVIILGALIVFRLFLPLIVKNYVNKTLNKFTEITEIPNFLDACKEGFDMGLI
ncbi:MAG: hypothetical protein CMB97_05190, partial [Flavobacteriaceae bacterium]|nr:hypothetical protein [Flavobacteriaceae bacterium]